jgi:Fe-S-cluster containining protein
MKRTREEMTKSREETAKKRGDFLKKTMGGALNLRLKVLVNHISSFYPKGIQRGLATQKTVDTVVQDALNKSPKMKTKIKCKQGCGACCFQQVQITDSEKELISGYVAQRNLFPNLEERKRLGRQARASRFGDWGELRHEDKRCIFLDEKQNCKIYEVRPMSCRSYFVVSDPAQCETKEKVQQVDIVQIAEADLVMVAAFHSEDKTGKSESLPQKLERIFS